MSRKIKKDADLLQFLEAVKACQEDVHFLTEEGDNLNLKSVLSQFVLVSLVGKPWLLEAASISCDREADYALLLPFLSEEPK